MTTPPPSGSETELLFLCLRCEQHYNVEAPTDRCPVCDWTRAQPQADGEARVDEVAAAVHEGRFSEGLAQINYCAFADEDSGGQQYCRRIARELLKQFRIARPTPTETVCDQVQATTDELARELCVINGVDPECLLYSEHDDCDEPTFYRWRPQARALLQRYEIRKRASQPEPSVCDQTRGEDTSVDAAFWCECGTPFSQDPETERKERAAGKCILCIGEERSVDFSTLRKMTPEEVAAAAKRDRERPIDHDRIRRILTMPVEEADGLATPLTGSSPGKQEERE